MNYKIINVVVMYIGAIIASILILVELPLAGFIVYGTINAIVYHIDSVVGEMDKIND